MKEKHDKIVLLDRKAVNLLNTCGVSVLKKGDEGMAANLCEAWIQQREDGLRDGRVEGRAEGRAEGRVEGRAEGRSQGEVSCIDKIMANLNLSLERACEVIGYSVEEYKKMKSMI